MIKAKKLKRVLFLISDEQHQEISSITCEVRKTNKQYSNSMFIREAVDLHLRKMNKKLKTKTP